VVEKNANVYSNGKLRCYLLFNCNFGFGNYLSIVRSFEHRKNITKQRISAHQLQIEVGRYQGTLPQNRVCRSCSTGEIDDEMIYLFKCVKCGFIYFIAMYSINVCVIRYLIVVCCFFSSYFYYYYWLTFSWGGRGRNRIFVSCNQYLSPLMLRVRISNMARFTTLCDKIVSDLREVGGFFRILRFPPPIKLTASI
jgi:hypothetical protein